VAIPADQYDVVQPKEQPAVNVEATGEAQA
jgi:hypothetical protein